MGRAAIALATKAGATVTGRVGPDAVEEARSLGLASVLDYTVPVPSDISNTFDVVFDCNGSLTPQDADRLLKPQGMVIDTNISFPKLWRAAAFRHRKLVFFNGAAERLQKVVDLAAAGALRLPIERTAGLHDAISMIADLERGKRANGKTVIQMLAQ